MIKVITYTKNPLTLMGEVAATCWDSTPSANIGKECIESGHGRIAEYADIVVEIDGYSARTIRELYTHIAGTSRVQSSTRYINYDSFRYYTPDSIIGDSRTSVKRQYHLTMLTIMEQYKKLIEAGVPKEDAANILPLGMISKMVLKINVRALLHLAETRFCTRTLKEFRELVTELLSVISDLGEEWKWIADRAKPVCEVRGYCVEKHGCGRYPRKDDVI